MLICHHALVTSYLHVLLGIITTSKIIILAVSAVRRKNSLQKFTAGTVKMCISRRITYIKLVLARCWDPTPSFPSFLPYVFLTCCPNLQTSFQAIICRTAPLSGGLLAEVFRGFPQPYGKCQEICAQRSG